MLDIHLTNKLELACDKLAKLLLLLNRGSLEVVLLWLLLEVKLAEEENPKLSLAKLQLRSFKLPNPQEVKLNDLSCLLITPSLFSFVMPR